MPITSPNAPDTPLVSENRRITSPWLSWLTRGGLSVLVNLVTEVIGILRPVNGGTGRATLTAHDVLVGNGTSAVTLISPSTAGLVLTSNGTSSDPSFQAGSSGTVTHTGTLTDHAVILGNGGADIEALGSLGTTTTVLHGNAAGDPSFATVVEADITLANNTTNNVSITKHGFTPILPNDATKFLNGTGAYSVPAGTGTGTVTNTGTLTSGKTIQGNGGVDVTVSSLTATVTKYASGTPSAASAGTDYVAPGSITTDGITMATGKLLGRTTASTGAVEEISAGTGLSLTGGVLSASGTPTGNIANGTAFPLSPATNDLFIRTDISNVLFFYDGTRWRSVNVFEAFSAYTPTTLTGTTDVGHWPPNVPGASDLWLLDFRLVYNIASNHTVSSFWAFALHKFDNSTDTTITTITTDKSTTTWNDAANSIGALWGLANTLMFIHCIKTGTPGNTFMSSVTRYQIVAT